MKTKRLIGALLSASVFCSAFCIAAPASAAAPSPMSRLFRLQKPTLPTKT